jgi:hypothetical protein
MNSPTPPDAQDRGAAKHWDFFSVFLCVACAVLAALVLLLVRQNHDLKAQVARLAAQAAIHDREALATGDRIPTFEATALSSGQRTRVDFGEGQSPALLLVFSSSCPACRQNMPVWNRVLAGSPSALVRIVGIRTAAPPPGAPPEPEAEPAFPVFTLDAPLDKLPYVPATVMLDGTGAVRKVWFGVLSEDQESELRAALRS